MELIFLYILKTVVSFFLRCMIILYIYVGVSIDWYTS